MASDIDSPPIVSEDPGPPGRWERYGITAAAVLGLLVAIFMLVLIVQQIVAEEGRSATVKGTLIDTNGSSDCTYRYTVGEGESAKSYTFDNSCEYRGDKPQVEPTVNLRYNPADPADAHEASSETAWTWLFLLVLPLTLAAGVPSAMWLYRLRRP